MKLHENVDEQITKSLMRTTLTYDTIVIDYTTRFSKQWWYKYQPFLTRVNNKIRS